MYLVITGYTLNNKSAWQPKNNKKENDPFLIKWFVCKKKRKGIKSDFRKSLSCVFFIVNHKCVYIYKLMISRNFFADDWLFAICSETDELRWTLTPSPKKKEEKKGHLFCWNRRIHCFFVKQEKTLLLQPLS